MCKSHINSVVTSSPFIFSGLCPYLFTICIFALLFVCVIVGINTTLTSGFNFLVDETQLGTISHQVTGQSYIFFLYVLGIAHIFQPKCKKITGFTFNIQAS